MQIFNPSYLTTSSNLRFFKVGWLAGAAHKFLTRGIFVCSFVHLVRVDILELSVCQATWCDMAGKKKDSLPLLSHTVLQRSGGTFLWGLICSFLFTKDSPMSHWKLGYERKPR